MDEANWQLIRDRATSVYLELPFDTIWERVGRTRNRPLLAGRLRKEVESLFDRRRPRYEQASHRVDADRSPDDVAAEVLALWSD
jgi:shikimate kinase